jgi:hypothetical protein
MYHCRHTCVVEMVGVYWTDRCFGMDEVICSFGDVMGIPTGLDWHRRSLALSATRDG